jgi:hypothetical protein
MFGTQTVSCRAAAAATSATSAATGQVRAVVELLYVGCCGAWGVRLYCHGVRCIMRVQCVVSWPMTKLLNTHTSMTEGAWTAPRELTTQ